MGMGLNHIVYPLINVYLSWKVFISPEEKKIENNISTIWQWIFTFIKKYNTESAYNYLFVETKGYTWLSS